MAQETAFINGQIVTADAQSNVYDALLIKDDHIIKVGYEKEINDYLSAHTHIIDLQGKSLLPGFIDSHAHIELQGTNMLNIDCKNISSIEEMKKKLKERASSTKQGEWVRGWGYNDKALQEKRHPTRKDLDEVSQELPIIVTRTCNHISVVNSKAMELYGLSDYEEDPVGGAFGRQENKLNGQLFESVHMDMYEFSQHSEQNILQGYLLASEHYSQYGVTSVHDAGGYGNSHFPMLFKGVHRNSIKQRLYVLVGSLSRSKEVLENSINGGMLTGMGDLFYKIGPAKLFIDGSSSGPTAATRDPYSSNENDSGILYYSQEELNETLLKAAKNEFQITSHAIGDLGIEMLLKCIHLANSETNKTQRHRIEHAALALPDLQTKMVEENVVPVLNPAFIYEFGDGYLTDYGERSEYIFPARDLAEKGLKVAFGSDNPITTINPFVGIYSAITRKTKTGKIVGSEQSVSLQEAIKFYTIHGAYASFEENIKGSIETDKKADFIILDRAILDTPIEDIKNTKIEKTFINGKVVYENK